MDIFDCWIYIVKNMNMFEQMPFSEKYPVFRKLAEIGDLRKLSREELELYDEDIKNMRDIYATRKFDEKKGMEKEKLATARRLLSMGLSDRGIGLDLVLDKELVLDLYKEAVSGFSVSGFLTTAATVSGFLTTAATVSGFLTMALAESTFLCIAGFLLLSFLSPIGAKSGMVFEMVYDCPENWPFCFLSVVIFRVI